MYKYHCQTLQQTLGYHHPPSGDEKMNSEGVLVKCLSIHISQWWVPDPVHIWGVPESKFFLLCLYGGYIPCLGLLFFFVKWLSWLHNITGSSNGVSHSSTHSSLITLFKLCCLSHKSSTGWHYRIIQREWSIPQNKEYRVDQKSTSCWIYKSLIQGGLSQITTFCLGLWLSSITHSTFHCTY